MSAQRPRKRLPVNPSIEHLKKQAKRLAAADPSLQLSDAQHQLAGEYGYKSWAELVHIVETTAQQRVSVKSKSDPLPGAANRNDIDEVRRILNEAEFTQHDLDLALARAVLRFSERRPIAELLIEHGADPDGQYGGNYGPIVLATGECVDPDGLQFLIDHGADVTFPPMNSKYGPTSPMISILCTYVRGHNEAKHRYIDILLKHGAYVPPDVPPEFMMIHRGDVAGLAAALDNDPGLLNHRYRKNRERFSSGYETATLLHCAVEFGEIECIDLLVARGADLNARAEMVEGVGGHTPIFHVIAGCAQGNLYVLEHLIKQYASRIDMTVRATIRTADDVCYRDVTPLEFATATNGEDTPDWRRSSQREVDLLRNAELSRK
ncbi:MAG TPA: hypothetical protein VH518_00020 [Tepidisphaeraceae bacterium]